jgi:DNA invertase Pin-like site-specific DNA recombinase
MIKDSAKHLFDVVIVWKLDRFARNRYDSAHYKNVLRKNGVRVISAMENISDGPEGIILETMLEGFAEYYSAELAQKVLRGMTENALKCVYNGGTIATGYVIDQNKHYQIDPVTAPIVLDIFTKYAEGRTIKEIVDDLKNRGISSARDGKVTINTVTHMLKNRRYIGEYIYRDVVVPGGVPQIIPQDLFDRVQKRMEKNRRAPARHKAEDDYLLTTKLHCGKCGSFMVGESGRSHTSRVYHYYKCANAKKGNGCKKKAAKKNWIEDLVVNETMQMIMNDAVLNDLADKVVDILSRENIQLPLLKKQLADTDRGIDNLLNAIQQGVLTPSTKRRMDELEERKGQLEIAILQEQIQAPVLTREQILYWLHKFRGIDASDKDSRQKLIDCFVNAVYLYDDKVALTFNYKDGTKHISLEEIQGSDLDELATP